MNHMAPLVVDCEIEFGQLPGRVFPVNLARLGLSLIQIDHPPLGASSSSPEIGSATPRAINRLRYKDTIDFPPVLITAFRVQDDSFMLDEVQGLSRMLASGFGVLMEGIVPQTELKAALAAMTLQQCLGLNCKIGNMAKAKAKAIARECLEDVLLARDTFRQLHGITDELSDKVDGKNAVFKAAHLMTASPSPSGKQHSSISPMETVQDKLSAALGRVAKLERENQRLLHALDEAYNHHRRSPTNTTPTREVTPPSPKPIARSRHHTAATTKSPLEDRM